MSIPCPKLFLFVLHQIYTYIDSLTFDEGCMLAWNIVTQNYDETHIGRKILQKCIRHIETFQLVMYSNEMSYLLIHRVYIAMELSNNQTCYENTKLCKTIIQHTPHNTTQQQQHQHQHQHAQPLAHIEYNSSIYCHYISSVKSYCFHRVQPSGMYCSLIDFLISYVEQYTDIYVSTMLENGLPIDVYIPSLNLIIEILSPFDCISSVVVGKIVLWRRLINNCGYQLLTLKLSAWTQLQTEQQRIQFLQQAGLTFQANITNKQPTNKYRNQHKQMSTQISTQTSTSNGPAAIRNQHLSIGN
jgi:hypothetical protein